MKKTKIVKESNNFLVSIEEIISLLPGNIYWMDKNGKFLGCNNNMLELIGLKSLNEYIGKTYEDIYEKTHIQIIKQTDRKVMEQNEPIVIEEVALHPGKEPVIYLTKKEPLHDKTGQVIGLLGVSLDITDRKKEQEELVKTKERAEAANIAKTEFLYNMRHDLRTPFAGIISIAEPLESQETDPGKKQALSYILQSAKILLNHLDEIFEFIETESGHLPLLDKQFDLHTLINDVYLMMLPVAKGKNIDFTYSLEQLPQYVIGDRTRTQRILMNLLSNAIKFTIKGGVTLDAKVAQRKDQSVVIQFTISDTGPGIPEDKQDIIFERFNRLTSSYSGIYSGKGLGLRLTKQFLDEIGGEIHLQAELGKGTTFQILIPLKLTLLDNSEPNV